MLPNFCDGISRRGVLRLGSLAGLSLAEAFRCQHAGAAPSPGRAKKDVNCIFIFMLGGMPHHDLWDLKPDAPAEIRGEFQSIRTSLPGVLVSEHLPRVSRWMDRTCLIRTVSHGYNSHNPYAVMTGFMSDGTL